jgi:hypothetical protein
MRLISSTIALFSSTLLISGCGDKEEAKQSNEPSAEVQGSDSAQNSRGHSGSMQPGNDSTGDDAEMIDRALKDSACRKAIESVAAHAHDPSYCKNNKGVEVCQWLYVAPDNTIIYDQRAEADCDKDGVNKPLACSEAVVRFP